MNAVYLSLFLLFLSPITLAEVKFVSQTGFIVENQVTVTKPVEHVWQSLIYDVDNWWPKDHSWWNGSLSIDPKAGGCFCEVKGDQSALHMTISYVDPNKVLRMIGGLGPLQEMGVTGALTWKLDDTDDQVQITLTYAVSGINPNGFASLAPIVDQVQAIQLGALAHHVQHQ